MVSTKGLVEKMGEVGYEVVKKYSWDIVGQQFIDTVEKYHKETGMATLSDFRMKRIV
jgi:glycosyltransferase involved in cell wall biosynthesis